MARFISLGLKPLFLFSLLLTFAFSTAYIPRLGGHEPPENPDGVDDPDGINNPEGGDNPDEISNPASRPENPAEWGEDSALGTYSPFSTSEEEDGPSPEELSELSEKIKDLINDIVSLFGPDSASSSALPALPTAAAQMTTFYSEPFTAISTSPTGQVNATLACEIYQTYTSLCPPPVATATPYTSFINNYGVPDGQPIVVDASSASQLSEQSRASCLCYSNTYYVPSVYDDAAWYCAGYTMDINNYNSGVSAIAAAATSAAQTETFCSSIGNVAGAAAATFGEFEAATTAYATRSATLSASPTRSTAAAGVLLGAEKGAWECVVAVVIIAALV